MRHCVHSAGVRSARFIVTLARDPGRDSTLERRSPEMNGGGVRSNLPLDPSLGEQSARTFGFAIPWHDPTMCDAAANATRPRRHDESHGALPNAPRYVISPSAIPGPALSLRWTCRVCPVAGTEGHAMSRLAAPEGGGEAAWSHLSSCITREHHLASRLQPRRVRLALGQGRDDLFRASGSGV